jgi:predicted Zn-dependent protease
MRSMPTSNAQRRAIELFELGGEHDSAGHETEAVRQYREAIELGLPADLDLQARIQLASTLRNLGEFEEAVAILRDVVAHEPGHRAARMFLSLALLSDGQPEAAVHELIDLLLTNPGQPERYTKSLRAYADDLVRPAAADDSDA